MYLGQQFGCVLEVLPVDPGAQVVHHPLLDLLLDALVRLGLQLEGLVVVLPLQEEQHPNGKLVTTMDCSRSRSSLHYRRYTPRRTPIKRLSDT